MKRVAFLWILTIIMITAFIPVTSFGADSKIDESGYQTEDPGYLVCKGDTDINARTDASKGSAEQREAAHIKLRQLMNTYADVEYYKDQMHDPLLPNAPTQDQLDELAVVAEEATEGCSTDYEKIERIYAFVADSLYYDRDLLNGLKPGDYGYDAWVSKTTICCGYAELCAIFLNSVDVSCIYVRGDRHAFNAAWDSQSSRWIFFDATWGSKNNYRNGEKIYNGYTYNYFDMSESKIASLNNHEFYVKLMVLPESEGDLRCAVHFPEDATKWTNTDLWDMYISEQLDKTVETVDIESEILGMPVVAIDKNAFMNCKSLTGITIPKAVTLIEYQAFFGCRNLTDLTLPGSLTFMGKFAFMNCKSLTEITIPDGVTSIEMEVFNGCSNLENVTLPAQLEIINSAAFAGCNSLKNINIPESVERIAKGVFSGCSTLCICCKKDSVAHAYAIENGINYKVWTSLSDCEVSLKKATYHTTGEPIIPAVTVLDGDNLLQEGVDYEVTGSDAIVGDSYIRITGLGDYGDVVEIPFTIMDHQWNDSYTVDQEATCTGEGVESIHCMICGVKKDERAIPATDHSFKPWQTVEESTCENPGLRQHTCEACGFTETEGLKPNGHDWEENLTVDVEATCTTEGSQSIHCSNCEARKDSVVIPTVPHEWEHVTNPAGLLENGSDYDQCVNCGATQNEEILVGYANYYVKSFKVDKGTKSFTAKWSKQSASSQKKFNGYEIRYSTKSDMSNAMTATAKKSSTSKTIKKLKKKTRYYVQVRTYTQSDGITFYSKWSDRKSVKTK